MVAGPACGQVLADLGAEVIKVEPPNGDITRRMGPDAGGVAALFASTNRGKRSLRLDLRDAEEAVLARRLVAAADVVIVNIDAAMLEKAGLSYDALAIAQPGLIWVDVTAFGPKGPLGTDGIAQAAMGLMSITGEANGPTYRTGASIVDVSTGVWAALGVLAALESRRKTGKGERIDVSLADVCLYMQYAQIALYAAEPASVRRNGNHSMISCTPLFTARDGKLMTTILHDRHWGSLCSLLGRQDLRDLPAFASNAARCDAQAEIERLLNPTFACEPRAHWVALLRAERIPCAPERTYDEILADPELRDRGQLFTLPTPRGSAQQVALPIHFADGRTAGSESLPDLGEGDEEIVGPLKG